MASDLDPLVSMHANAGQRLEAAQLFLAGYIKMYEAAIDDGSPEQIRLARNEVLSATESVLELKEMRKRIFLESWNINPEHRHLRFKKE